jgi:hypothetical protein
MHLKLLESSIFISPPITSIKFLEVSISISIVEGTKAIVPSLKEISLYDELLSLELLFGLSA